MARREQPPGSVRLEDHNGKLLAVIREGRLLLASKDWDGNRVVTGFLLADLAAKYAPAGNALPKEV